VKRMVDTKNKTDEIYNKYCNACVII